MLLSAAAICSYAAEKPYEIKKSSVAPTIDGVIDDGEYSDGVTITFSSEDLIYCYFNAANNFYGDASEIVKSPISGTIYVKYHENGIYFAFDINDKTLALSGSDIRRVSPFTGYSGCEFVSVAIKSTKAAVSRDTDPTSAVIIAAAPFVRNQNPESRVVGEPITTYEVYISGQEDGSLGHIYDDIEVAAEASYKNYQVEFLVEWDFLEDLEFDGADGEDLFMQFVFGDGGHNGGWGNTYAQLGKVWQADAESPDVESDDDHHADRHSIPTSLTEGGYEFKLVAGTSTPTGGEETAKPADDTTKTEETKKQEDSKKTDDTTKTDDPVVVDPDDSETEADVVDDSETETEVVGDSETETEVDDSETEAEVEDSETEADDSEKTEEQEETTPTEEKKSGLSTGALIGIIAGAVVVIAVVVVLVVKKKK